MEAHRDSYIRPSMNLITVRYCSPSSNTILAFVTILTITIVLTITITITIPTIILSRNNLMLGNKLPRWARPALYLPHHPCRFDYHHYDYDSDQDYNYDYNYDYDHDIDQPKTSLSNYSCRFYNFFFPQTSMMLMIMMIILAR